MKNIRKSEVLTLKELVAYQEGQVVSKTLAQNDAVSVTLISFDKGEESGKGIIFVRLPICHLQSGANPLKYWLFKLLNCQRHLFCMGEPKAWEALETLCFQRFSCIINTRKVSRKVIQCSGKSIISSPSSA